MSVRIKDLATTATSPANDDYIAIDGATNGTRKIPAGDIGGGGTSDDITNESNVSGETVTGALNSLSDQIANEATARQSAVSSEASTRESADESLRSAIDALVSPQGQSVVVDSSLSISGAAADAKVTGDAVSDLKSDLTNSAERLFNIDGVLNVPPYAIGNRYVSDGQDSFSSSVTRVSMAYGKYVHLYSGDTVESIDSSIYEFGGGYTVDGVNFISIANRISLLTITDEGDYFFRYRKLDSTPFSDSDLDTQVLIITNNRPYFVKEVDEKFDELEAKINGESIKYEWVRGTRYVNNGVDTYIANTNRVSMKPGTYANLKKGDIVVNLHKNLYQLIGGYTTDGASFTSIPSQIKDYKVSVDGQYFFMIVPLVATVVNDSNLGRISQNVMFVDAETTGINVLNEDFDGEILQALRRKNASNNEYLSAPQPLSLFHFSDIHADETELVRIVNFYNSHLTFIDDAICTGDLVSARWSDGIDFWLNTGGAEKIMIAVGNHDVLSDASGFDFTQRKPQSEQFARYIAPFYSGWNVSSSVSGDLTYYYKDYAANGIRLIVLNDMLEGADMTAQVAWLVNTLDDAISNSLSVVVAHHCPNPNTTKVECNWSNADNFSENNYQGSVFSDAVDSFIGNGGTFICFICGHLHWDQIAVFTGTNGKQLSIGIDALNRVQSNQFSDTERTNGEKSQDCANVIVFDTASGVIKVVRIGANRDHYLRLKNCLTIKYDGTIITQN